MMFLVTVSVLMFVGGSVEGFTSPIAPVRVERIHTPSQLEAVSVPLQPGDIWGGAVGGATKAPPRGHKDRIQEVLERAKFRTGVPTCSPTPSTKKEKSKSKASIKSKTRPGELPFTLPQLSEQQMMALQAGEIVQEQSEMGCQGSGFVVQDVQANEQAIWNHCLLDIDSYVRNIHTVRSIKRLDKPFSPSSGALESSLSEDAAPIEYGYSSTQRACFTISKFQLQIATRLTYHAVENESEDSSDNDQQQQQQTHYMELTLDNSFAHSVLQSAKGIWYTQRISEVVTRLWLLCDLTVSPLLPPFIVDSAATKAMPRASQWIRPTVARALTTEGNTLSP